MWYIENVRNITISLPDDVYKQARIRAAEHDTSVSGLVRGLLLKLTTEESAAEGRKRRIGEVIEAIHQSQTARGENFRAADRMSRDELYDRKAFR